MKFTCTQENLNKGLTIVSRLVGKTLSLPILENILLRANKSGLELQATNLELGVTTIVRGKTELEGEVLSPAKLLYETVSLFPLSNIDLSVRENSLDLKNSKQKISIRVLPTEDFPVIPQLEGGEVVKINTVELKEALNQVCFAVNPDESRPEISGVYLTPHPSGMVMVGTDSYRLAESVLLKKTGGLKKGVVISLRAAHEIERILNDETDEFTQLTFSDSQVLCEVGDTKITSRLVGSDYPDYKAIIPTQFATTFLVKKEELIKAVRVAGLFVRSGINDVKLMVSPEGKTLSVASANSQVGEQLTELTTTEAVGENMEIVFNFKYLLDGLQSIHTEMVWVGLVSSKDPGVFKPKSADNYQYIVMPIRQ